MKTSPLMYLSKACQQLTVMKKVSNVEDSKKGKSILANPLGVNDLSLVQSLGQGIITILQAIKKLVLGQKIDRVDNKAAVESKIEYVSIKDVYCTMLYSIEDG